MKATAVALLLAAVPARAFVTISQSRFGAQVNHIRDLFANTSDPSWTGWPHTDIPDQQLLGYTWKVPSDPTSKDGLGGGITWAWDPNFCDQIMPRFREDFFFVPFVTCSMIKAAMGRGFASWASNHAMLSFTDVTVECEKLGQLNEGCPLAEIWVTANGADGGVSGGVQEGQSAEGLTVEPVEERLGGGTSAALAVPVARYALDFRYTNGVRPSTGRVIET